MKNYTEQAKAHIQSLIDGGLTKQDIMLRYTANRVTIAHPVVEPLFLYYNHQRKQQRQTTRG